MAEAAWAAIGLQAATLFGMLFWLGSRIDGLSARIDGLSGRIDSLEQSLNARIDGLNARLDAHLEWHAS
ncbi:MAG TPA: hypothetical protein VGB52_12770 [Actinomycetota bacterium]